MTVTEQPAAIDVENPMGFNAVFEAHRQNPVPLPSPARRIAAGAEKGRYRR
jgi:hypothetical protein